MDGGRGPCESAAIDGMGKGLNGEVKGREWGGKEKIEPTILHRPISRSPIFLN